jgi:hypothetical protein
MNELIITKKDFDKLYDEDISKKLYDTIIGKVESRFYEIMTTIFPSTMVYDYGYEVTVDGREFEPNVYKENITFSVEECSVPSPWDLLCCVPTKWLWSENYLDEWNLEIQKHEDKELEKKEKQKFNRQKRNGQREIVIDSVSKKLTPEEMKWVQFKK